jgi:hypothetical protein
VNIAQIPHNFSIDSLNIDVNLKKNGKRSRSTLRLGNTPTTATLVTTVS